MMQLLTTICQAQTEKDDIYQSPAINVLMIVLEPLQ